MVMSEIFKPANVFEKTQFFIKVFVSLFIHDLQNATLQKYARIARTGTKLLFRFFRLITAYKPSKIEDPIRTSLR